jgi:hypothetical protein
MTVLASAPDHLEWQFTEPSASFSVLSLVRYQSAFTKVAWDVEFDFRYSCPKSDHCVLHHVTVVNPWQPQL